ncbi:hypothetical protein [Terrarubrum flagellatum]|uniref:hypothetical protein n=1 Tax=Terrirubrum flagellatum TaxID=2895980 RepID=UPI003144ECB9
MSMKLLLTGAACAAMSFATLVSSAAAQSAPADQLKSGERACYGASLGKADLARAPKGAISEVLVELHRELLNGADDTVWGALHVRLKGAGKSAFVKDGCQKQQDGSLRCSIACDGGAFMISNAGDGAISLAVGEDGVRVRTCGSSLKQLGTALLKPADIAIASKLTPRPASQCRQPMARFEKLLEKEEAGID